MDTPRLVMQLGMFKMQFKYTTMADAKSVLQAMLPEVRRMFSEVEQLVRLLLLCPVSSCEAERSFSSLRRLNGSGIVCHRNDSTQLGHYLPCPPGHSGQP